MKTTWILSAHRGGATLFAHHGRGPLTLVRELDHPEGRRRDRELGDDAPGRSYESGSSQRSTLGTDRSPTRDLAAGFARSLAEMLAREHAEGAFGQLVLMAEPRFLGLLREALDARTAGSVLGSIAKELPHPTAESIRPHLRGLPLP